MQKVRKGQAPKNKKEVIYFQQMLLFQVQFPNFCS